MPLKVSFCGFGGQGIILSAVILGTTAVTKNGYFAVQTQSYGSEARGGQCQAELIIDSKQIGSPVTAKKDILVCLFQDAYNKYIGTLRRDGILIIDPKLVLDPHDKMDRTFSLPATEIAVSLGNRMAANMVVLGFISESTGLIKKDDLLEVIKEHVSEKYHELNTKAVEAGIEYARANSLYV